MDKNDLKWPQIDAAFKYIYDNSDRYHELFRLYSTDILEFGVGSGRSLAKIVKYLKEFDITFPVVYGFDAWQGLPVEKEGIAVFDKFSPGSYWYHEPDEFTLRDLLTFNNIFLYNTYFDKLDNIPCFDVRLNALLIHIDCDLYISTKQALDWCFKHNMVKEHTLIAFDEFKSTDRLSGEQLAWQEIASQYKFESEEIWHNTYYDKDTGQKFRQSLWEIIKI